MPYSLNPEVDFMVEKLLPYLQRFITLETLEQERVLFFNNCHCETSAQATAIGTAFHIRKTELTA